MFYFVGASKGKTVFFKESFLREIEKVRNKLYGVSENSKTFLEGRPVFTLLCELDAKVIRLEYFERDSMSLAYDSCVNAPLDQLPNLVEFLKKAFDLPDWTIKPMIEKIRENGRID